MLFQNNGADFGEGNKYRYALWRIWDESKPMVMFIGLNPSTANAITDDPTIRRIKSFAAKNNYGGVFMMNLFPYVTAYPSELIECTLEQMSKNRIRIEELRERCEDVIFAWGNFKEAERVCKDMKSSFPDALCLQKNKNGSPKHPLYVRSDIKPIKFNS